MTHLAELDAASPTTNDFDALELGIGNDVITAFVDRTDGTSKLVVPGLVQVKSGYPVLGDEDPRNTGAAADKWTWAFEINGAATGPFVASTGWLTNYALGAPLATEPVGFAWNDILQVRSDQVCTVFLNGKTGSGASVLYVYEEIQAETATAATYTQRATHVASYPQGQRAAGTRYRAEVVEGAPVFVMLRMLGETGAPLTRADVVSVRFRLRVEDRATGRWNEIHPSPAYSPDEVVAVTPVQTDLRWPHQKGYNVGAWVELTGVAPGRRVLLEPEVRTEVGLVEVPEYIITVLPRAGRYGGV